MKRTAFVLGAVLLSFVTLTPARGEQAGKPPPRVDTKSLRDDMANEIKAILTEEQKKKFDEMLADMGKKKKKA